MDKLKLVLIFKDGCVQCDFYKLLLPKFIEEFKDILYIEINYVNYNSQSEQIKSNLDKDGIPLLLLYLYNSENKLKTEIIRGFPFVDFKDKVINEDRVDFEDKYKELCYNTMCIVILQYLVSLELNPQIISEKYNNIISNYSKLVEYILSPKDL